MPAHWSFEQRRWRNRQTFIGELVSPLVSVPTQVQDLEIACHFAGYWTDVIVVVAAAAAPATATAVGVSVSVSVGVGVAAKGVDVPFVRVGCFLTNSGVV